MVHSEKNQWIEINSELRQMLKFADKDTEIVIIPVSAMF